MGDEKSKKRIIVEISSSDESKSPPSESDEDAAEEISSSTSCNSEDEDMVQVSGDEVCDTGDVDKPDADSMYSKVVQFIRERSDLQELKADECKAYLRRHKLRLSGTKEECIERIEEHWMLKDGSGEVYYPRESFKINCTGDVCQGDIVLFHQKVHQRSGRNRIAGRRTVAGRIIKDSYGATRQQHTFTVEVLWNKGAKKLDPLFPLLVKGRNLYKMKTYRQLWKNEKERLEVLDEKHRRGNAARAVRDNRRTKTAMNKNESLAFKGGQHCKRLGSSKSRETSRGKKYLNEGSKQNAGSRRGSASHHNYPNRGRLSPSRSYYYPSQSFFPPESHNFHSYGGFASVAGLPYPYPYPHPLPYSSTRHTSRWRDISHESSFMPSYPHSTYENEAAGYNYPRLTGSHRSLHPTTERHQRR